MNLGGLRDWLTNHVRPVTHDRVSVFIAPGSYEGIEFNPFSCQMTLEKCLDCRNGAENEAPARISILPNTLFHISDGAVLTLKGLHFNDSHEMDTLTESALIAATHANVSIVGCTFSNIRRSAPLVVIVSGYLRVESTQMIDNVIIAVPTKLNNIIAGLLEVIGGAVLQDSNFERNELVVPFSLSSAYLCGGVVLRARYDYAHLLNSTFIQNVLRVTTSSHLPPSITADSIPIEVARIAQEKKHTDDIGDSRILVRGTIFIEDTALHNQVSGCKFIRNEILDETSSVWQGGAAISATELLLINIENTEFEDNRAEIGNALHVFGIYSASEVTFISYVNLKNVTVTGHRCILGGCGVAITSANRPIAVTITDSLFQESVLEFPRSEAPSATRSSLRSFTGGAALLISFPSTEPLRTSLTLTDTIFRSNDIGRLPQFTPGGGVDVALYQVLDVTISRVSFIDSVGAVRFGVLWARMFNSFAIKDTIFHQPKAEETMYRSIPFVDLQDTITFYDDIPRLVTISNASFTNCVAGSLIYIADVHEAELSNINFDFDLSGAEELHMTSLTTISVFRVEKSLKIFNISQETVGVIVLSDIETVHISDSSFGSHIFEHTSAWQLKLNQVRKATIRDSYFHANHTDGCLHASYTDLDIISSRFVGCTVPTPFNGAAIYAEFCALTVISSEFSNCRAESGAAIALMGSAYIRDSIFTNNTANSNGGGLHSSFGDVTVETCTFRNNTADLGAAIHITGSASAPQNKINRATETVNPGQRTYSSLEVPKVVINASNFEYGYGTSGGAIYATYASKIVIVDSQFSNNKADSEGGALYLGLRGKHRIFSSTFSGNFAGKEDPRLQDTPSSVKNGPQRIYRHGRPSTKLYGTFSGGAIVVPSGSINITSSIFTHNCAEMQAGAILLANLANSPLSLISNTTLSSNVAGFSGGAISVLSSLGSGAPSCILQLSNVSMLDNSAMFGGAMEYSPDKSCEFRFNLPVFSNISFRHNSAEVSGGAIFITYPTYFLYDNLIFEDNSANISGGTFFLNGRQARAIELCAPDRCSISADWSRTKYVPRWGRFQASSGWHPQSSTFPPFIPTLEYETGESWEPIGFLGTEAPLDRMTQLMTSNRDTNQTDAGALTLSNYQLAISFIDAYGQIVDESVRINIKSQLVCTKFDDNGPTRRCPFLSSGDTGTDLVYVRLLADSPLLRPLQPFQAELHAPSPFEHDIPISLTFEIDLLDYDPDALHDSQMKFVANLTGCAAGSGLTNATDSSFGSCSPCAINSYNIKSDGYCYLCNSFDTTNLECEGNTVAYRDNYWVSAKPDSNALLVEQCLIGYCDEGTCTPHRTGVLCAQCEEGSYESLFSTCSPNICSSPSIALFIAIAVATVVVTIVFHILMRNWAAVTLFWILIAQVSFSMLAPYFDWALPIVSSTLATLLCGKRMDIFERYFFLTFVPYASFGALLLLWLFLLILSKLQASRTYSFRTWLSDGELGCKRRLLKTSAALAYVCSFWTLGRSVDWLKCHQTVFGHLWRVAPQMSCTSPEFIRNRALFLTFSVPLALLPMLGCLVFLVINRPNIRPRLVSVTWRARVFSILNMLFHFTTSYSSAVWPFTDLILLRLVLPVIQSSLAYHASLQASFICVLLMVATGISALHSPHLTLWMRYCSTGYLGALAILSIVKLDFAYNPKLAIAIVGVNIVSLLALAIGLIFGLPKSKTNEGAKEDIWGNAGANEVIEAEPLLPPSELLSH